MKNHPFNFWASRYSGTGANASPSFSRNIRRLLIGCAMLLGWVCAPAGWAAPVSEQEALSAAQGWLRACQHPLEAALSGTVAGVRTFRTAQGQPLFYVVDLKPEGFVILSADTQVEPIIAFAAAGVYEDSPQSPLRGFLEADLAGRSTAAAGPSPQLKGLDQSGSASSPGKWARLVRWGTNRTKSIGLTAVDDLRVAPFVQSHWNQGAIWTGSTYAACFNYYTPPYAAGTVSNYNGGCVNTAWAQMLRYFQYPTQAVGTAEFDIQVDGVPARRSLRGGDGAGGPYQWTNMVLTPNGASTEEQRQAIGALTADLAVASGTDFIPTNSVTVMTDWSLRNIFHFGNVIYEYVSQVGDETQKIHPNLDASIPVYLGITGTNAVNGAVTHAAVCDGYGYNLGTLYHHLNLGWSGYADAWYNLPLFAATPFTFTNLNALFYNVFPTGQGEIISGRVAETNGAPIAGAQVDLVGGGTSRSVQTDSRGIYAFAPVPSQTAFSVTVTKPGLQFYVRDVATGRSQNHGLTGNRWGVDFVAFPPQLRLISGRVLRVDGNGVPGVTVEFSNGGGSVATDASGFYCAALAAGWTGTVKPLKARHFFEPDTLSLDHNASQRDFLAIMRVYVDADAVLGDNDGSSWVAAFTNLAIAIQQAPVGAELWVAEGTYYPGVKRETAFAPKLGMTLYGGFEGSETHLVQRDWVEHETILSGDIGLRGNSADNAYHVCAGTNQARLDGFTITGGNANSPYLPHNVGGGAFSADGIGNFVVANCLIVSNAASWGGGGGYGGVFVNCVLSDNSAPYGGATYGSSNLDCTLVRNAASQNGGGACGGTLVNCLVATNTAPLGGGTYSSTNLDCRLFGNAATQKGGGGYGGVLSNCVIVGNTADSGGGAAGSTNLDGTYSLTVLGCQVLGNSALFSGGGGALGSFQGCTIASNAAIYGGGTFQADNLDCQLTRNAASKSGGGGYGGTFSNCVMTGNTAAYGGGAHSATNLQCRLVANSATSSGGGGSGGCFLSCTVLSNSAPVGGGGVYGWFQDCVIAGNTSDYGSGTYGGTVLDSQLAGNTAGQLGGGAYSGTLSNCVVSRNTARCGGGGASATFLDCTVATNHAAVDGGGTYCNTNRDCLIIGNSAATNGGGGIFGLFANCVITRNSARYGGGGCAATFSGCDLTTNSAVLGGGQYGGSNFNCRILGNTAVNDGGGTHSSTNIACLVIGNSATSATSGTGGGTFYSLCRSCQLLSNTAKYGGGARGGNFYSCLIASNRASFAGGGGYTITNRNCTLTANTAQWGAGLFSGYAVNSILTGNNGANYYVGQPSEHADSVILYSCAAPLPPGAGNITAKPLFVGQAWGDYRLGVNSPCVNRGLNQPWMTAGQDLAGGPRIRDALVDMGAYEAVVQFQAARIGDTVSLTCADDGVPATAYQWYLNGVKLNNSPRRSGVNQPVLQFSNLKATDSARFVLVVTKQPGYTISQAVDLKVDTQCPVVSFTSPAAGAQVWPANGLLALKGVASDNSWVTNVACQANDGPWTSAAPVAGWGSWTGQVSAWTGQVTLRGGTNLLRVYAQDAVGLCSTTALSVQYVVRKPLELHYTPGRGTVTGATNGQKLEVGRNYTLTAAPKRPGFVLSNWTDGAGHVLDAAAACRFQMQSNSVLWAHFVPDPFPALMGSWVGLFSPADPAQWGATNCGFVGLTLGQSGGFSGRLLLEGTNFPVSGALDVGLKGKATVVRTGKPPLTVNLQVVANQVTGSVACASWSAGLATSRATNAPAPFGGNFTMLLGGDDDGISPPGDGAASVNVSAAGVLSLTGALADRAPFSQAVKLPAGGRWPFYASLYNGRGLACGWLQLPRGNEVVTVPETFWLKPPQVAKDPYYTNGFRVGSPVVLARYVTPKAASNVVNWTSGALALSYGNLPQPLTNTFTVSKNKVTVTGGSITNLVLNFTATNGLFSGSFLHPNTKKTVPFSGAVIQGPPQQDAYGEGWFAGTNECGWVEIRHKAP